MRPEAVMSVLLALSAAGPQAAIDPNGVTDPSPARPYFRLCRSTDFTTFTCWWSIEDVGNTQNTSYTLTYKTGESQAQECPDYTTGGDKSCFFDKKHALIWNSYCLVVTAHSPSGSASSKEFCVHMTDIVEPDPPFNLSWSIVLRKHASAVLMTWTRPDLEDPSNARIPLLHRPLLYQLNYSHAAPQSDWQGIGPFAQKKLQLFSLTPGESYLVKIRCKYDYGRWSDWSKVVELQVPGTVTRDSDLLMLLLLLLLPVTAFLFIGLRCLLLRQRYQRFLVPPNLDP